MRVNRKIAIEFNMSESYLLHSTNNDVEKTDFKDEREDQEEN